MRASCNSQWGGVRLALHKLCLTVITVHKTTSRHQWRIRSHVCTSNAVNCWNQEELKTKFSQWLSHDLNRYWMTGTCDNARSGLSIATLGMLCQQNIAESCWMCRTIFFEGLFWILKILSLTWFCMLVLVDISIGHPCTECLHRASIQSLNQSLLFPRKNADVNRCSHSCIHFRFGQHINAPLTICRVYCRWSRG